MVMTSPVMVIFWILTWGGNRREYYENITRCAVEETRGAGVSGEGLRGRRVSKRVTQRDQSSHIYPRQAGGWDKNTEKQICVWQGEIFIPELNIGKILQKRHLQH